MHNAERYLILALATVGVLYVAWAMVQGSSWAVPGSIKQDEAPAGPAPSQVDPSDWLGLSPMPGDAAPPGNKLYVACVVNVRPAMPPHPSVVAA